MKTERKVGNISLSKKVGRKNKGNQEAEMRRRKVLVGREIIRRKYDWE